MTERWVINASPLILLGKSGQLDWLPKLGRVVVPAAVATEIAAGAQDDPARNWFASEAGLSLIQADMPVTDDLRAWDLGAGETAVLAWAIQHPEHEAILDDAAARACASVYHLRYRGTLSLVALAKKRGFISACRPVFSTLKSAGLFVTDHLIEQVARAANE